MLYFINVSVFKFTNLFLILSLTFFVSNRFKKIESELNILQAEFDAVDVSIEFDKFQDYLKANGKKCSICWKRVISYSFSNSIGAVNIVRTIQRYKR